MKTLIACGCIFSFSPDILERTIRSVERSVGLGFSPAGFLPSKATGEQLTELMNQSFQSHFWTLGSGSVAVEPQRTSSQPSVCQGIQSKKQMRCALWNKTAMDLLQITNMPLWSSSKRKPGKCTHQPLSLTPCFCYHVANRLEGFAVRPVADVSLANIWFWSFSCEMSWFDFFVMKEDHQMLACFAPSGRGVRFLFHRELSRSVTWEVVEVRHEMEDSKCNAGNGPGSPITLTSSLSLSLFCLKRRLRSRWPSSTTKKMLQWRPSCRARDTKIEPSYWANG